MEAPQKLDITNVIAGFQPPPGVVLPSLHELVQICNGNPSGPVTGVPYPKGLAYPPGAPTIWIKHKCSPAAWHGVAAQMTAYTKLRELGSSVWVPAIYYAYEISHKWTYIVMQYVPDPNALALAERATTEAERDRIWYQVARALTDIYRIPIPNHPQPANIDGTNIVNPFFSRYQDCMAPRAYSSVAQLQQHINKVLHKPLTCIRATRPITWLTGYLFFRH